MKQRHFEISCPYRKNHKDDYTGDRNKGYRGDRRPQGCYNCGGPHLKLNYNKLE